MYNAIKIGLIGGDSRQRAIAKRFAENGFETAIWGFGDGEDVGASVRCVDFESVVNKSRAVILPLPVSRDGVHISTQNNNKYTLRLSQLFEKIEQETVVFGGKFDDGILEIAAKKGIRVFDVFNNEELQIKNAVPTAEGAIELALREMDTTLFGAETLVCGYGRIGRILADRLKAFGAVVTVAARKPEDIAYINIFGCNSTRFEQGEYLSVAKRADVIFNTVPNVIFDADFFAEVRKDSLIIDLATGGGVDFDAASKNNIKVIHALALPGKVAPISAGEILFECILEKLCKEGVIAKK